MKIVHIVEDYSIMSGGIRTVVKNLHTQLLLNKHNSLIVSPFFEEKDEGLVKIPLKAKTPWVFSRKLKSILEKLNNDSRIDVIHIHGAWMYPQYCASKFAYKKHIPFIISFHGMYEPWLWKSGYFKKKLYTKLLTNKLFSKANAIHSITESETNDLKNRFINSRIVEIPNLISFNILESEEIVKKESDYILFLGRLNPIKGINLLISAYAKIKEKNKINLKIAGPFNNYQKELKEQVKLLSLEDNVEFLGVVNGKEKQTLFENALVFVSPSYSEVIGMVNLESALYGTVVITTHATGLSKEWTNNGGFLINPSIDEIKKSLEIVFSWDEKTRKNNEKKLKEFVKKTYSWEERFCDWENLYNSVC